MKRLIKKLLVKILDPLILRLGYHTEKSSNPLVIHTDLLDNFYRLLKKINFVPKHIIDVGANHGNWTRSALNYFPDAYYTLLEPQNWLKSSINDLLESNQKIKFYPVGAGSTSGTFKFTIVNRDDSSSFRFTDEQAKTHGFEQIDIEIVTLNQFIGQLNLPIPDIIKIDAEGFDLEVLKGASSFFGRTEIFMVEAGIGSKDINNSFLNVINFMNENEYRLFEITDLNRPFEIPVLWLTELVFIKKNGIIDSQKIIQS
jgi:FkbM family methyltransferase